MNRAEKLEEFMHVRGGKVTLGQIIREGDSTFSYKVTAAISELREKLKAKNMTIVCAEHRDHPTENEYEIVPLLPRVDGKGQMGLGI